ncbi:carbonic anhydrase 4a isoform X2 [Myripristis murdjan]|uniref:carbonic anhydrase 4a isoform X2 n=1 Tax=Myripristis murdjan TaxID=586833 RepID=UPI001175E7D5|nr:carbonic anhydrase 4-like isoform X2 [Myripristis murdjan]
MQHLILPIILASVWTICTGADWCYQSQFTCDHKCNAPEKWDHANGACAGRAQSPINIITRKTRRDERLTPFQFSNYQHAFKSTIENNGHSVQVPVTHLATISGGDLTTEYKAVQFHLHWGKNGGPGSEHTIDGEQFPMELHIVHMKERYTNLSVALSDPYGVAVLGFFYEESKSTNKKYEPIINALRSVRTPKGSTSLPAISLGQLIPAPQNLTNYYRYKGSLTTPGCTESVVWTVFENTIPLSREQLRAFSELQFQDGKQMVDTFRPVQPLNGRLVYRSGGAAVLASAALLVMSVAMALGLSQPN